MITESQVVLAAAMTEAELQRNVEQMASLCGWLTWHDHDARKNDAGLPDLILLGHGRVLWVELKREHASLRKAQRAFRDALLGNGAEWYLWRPRDWLSGRIEETLRGWPTYSDEVPRPTFRCDACGALFPREGRYRRWCGAPECKRKSDAARQQRKRKAAREGTAHDPTNEAHHEGGRAGEPAVQGAPGRRQRRGVPREDGGRTPPPR